MIPVTAVVLAALSAGLLQTQEAQAQQPTVRVVAKRFLRGDATLVDGLCQVPLGMLTALPNADGVREGIYRLDVTVRDADGLLLHESGWSQTVAAQFLDVDDASTVEHFSFAVPSGRYTVSVSVVDSATGAVERSSVEVDALPSDERVSDLLLSSEIRRTVDETALAGPGEFQKGAFLVSANAQPVLTPTRAVLYYYLEFYSGDAVALEFAAAVHSARGGQVITSAQPQRLDVGAGGGVAVRSLDLTGLPEGEYELRVAVEFPDGTVDRTSGFTMAGFETTEHMAELTAAAPAADPFAELTEARLDSLYGPLDYVMEDAERGVYQDLSLSGKRSYLREFWAKRDPTPGTPENEAMVAYYRLFAEANRRYRESGAGRVQGWRTDRGRVFLKRGDPEETFRRPVAGNTPPFEVWKYSRPRQLKYVFVDHTGLGNYQLVYTNDRFEASRGDWEALLGPQAVQDVIRF